VTLGYRQVDEYELEIGQVRRTLARLVASHANSTLIHEYELELRNLRALYQAATETYAAAAAQPEVVQALRLAGFGEWTLAAVYAFVYEASMALDADAERLAATVEDTDYVASLRLVLGRTE